MALKLSPALSVLPAARGRNPSSTRGSPSPLVAAILENGAESPLISSSSTPSGVPKLEPFSQSRVSRLMKGPSLLEKAEHAILDRCTILEGDDAYNCWEAFSEFEDMKHEYSAQCNIAAPDQRQTECHPLERFENFVRQSGGAASLVKNVRMLALANKKRKSAEETPRVQAAVSTLETDASDAIVDGSNSEHFFPEPGALPPTKEELQLEEEARMPESSFTRLLRAVGNPAPWFSQSTS
ncbi:hypothetical protein KP509_13G002300 [Ceratopteris richardii]|uniref:Uncharacterized protein n=1 Tax=Ceratopteris richardii TaxID=49495 RepID=A0A8T2TEQ9_CERRI|nr:hypothetical protein KP509_13G002300 [Ceratopteris richardii]